MSRMKWVRHCFDDAPEAWWITCQVTKDIAYSIDSDEGAFHSWMHGWDGDKRAGPRRKTLQSAVNDCRVHARKLREALVEFGRCDP